MPADSLSNTHERFVLVDEREHFDRLMQALDWEADEEARRFADRLALRDSRTAEKSGESLLDLAVVDVDAGLGQNVLVTFRKRNRQAALPWHRLKVGSPVLVSTQSSHVVTQAGVVSSRRSEQLQVSMSSVPQGDRFRIDLSTDEISRKRQQAALVDARGVSGRAAELKRVLLGMSIPEFSDSPTEAEEHETEVSTALNASQQDAVRFCLSAQDLAIIHGPPGTGKTTTVVELIVQSIARGEKVLACAPSNTATDNLLERLVNANQNVVRIGHPARVDERLRSFTLDGLAASHELQGVIQEIRREADELFRKADRWTRAKPSKGARQAQRRDAKLLLNEARRLEQTVIEQVLDQADAICATTTFDSELIGSRRFDVAVIDEACQSTEPGCWIPVLRANRVVLAGDHCQLPPTVLSPRAVQVGFQVSLLERLMGVFGERIHRQLRVQYRMNEAIMRFSSREFYEDHLQAHVSVVDHTLSDLTSERLPEWCRVPLTFVDTAGAGWQEEVEPDGMSRLNKSEGAFIIDRVNELIAVGLDAAGIGIIAPYAAQVRLLRDLLGSTQVEVDTVDGFQGREKEAILISCVRSNSEGEIGFLADTRRMNVALTRAKRCLLVIGDSATLGSNSFFARMLTHFESERVYRTVWEWMTGD